ncbi:SpoIIE family protein phosphatase [Candidatus Poribacteria bacterium]|nr:SpoIIE family protein phosphatase [Candidatus Poribacteria bacterium]
MRNDSPINAINRDLIYSQSPATVKLTMVPDLRDPRIAQLESDLERRNQELEYLNARLAELNEQLADENVRMGAELKEARDMQMSLLPTSPPQIKGFDIAAICEPATDVGGDYFTYLWLDDAKTQLGVVLIDVVGHGMKAATTTFIAKGILQSESRGTQSPKEILTKMHISLKETLPKRSFVATAFAQINLRNRTLMHFNAGLPEPILFRRGKPIGLPILSATPLGCPLRAKYEAIPVPLLSGDVLLFFSDGLVEAMDTEDQMYETQRLWQQLSSLFAGEKRAQAWVETLERDVRAFVAPNELDDDLTVVVVKVQ